MAKKKNILWIMADQLRWDYLSCYGSKALQTPTMDALAAKGVRFSNAYVNATVCGPSRMCYYTGRYMSSHGSTWNNVPLRVGEPTLGDHLRKQGYRVAIVGKTHMETDIEGMERLGLTRDKIEGVYASEAGFEPYLRDDGLHPDQIVRPDLEYNLYLKEKGYEGNNPWHSAANAGVDEDGDVLSGWFLRNAAEPALVADEHSETAFMTDRAMDFIRDADPDQPWLLHLSYIKPHWPYIVSPPYHNMFSAKDVPPANRSKAERDNPHPVYEAHMRYPESQSFSKDEVRDVVVPIYMGLIRQIDDHLARMMQFLKEQDLLDDTLIVISSDHGDYLGDHWLGEKELFHDESAKVPLIIVDPSSDADANRGSVCDELVQSIDLAATFTDLAGCSELGHVLEGKSLMPLLHGNAKGHDVIISELDYGHRDAGTWLDDRAPIDCRAYMVLTKRWKFIFYEGYASQLFDRENDPGELIDLAANPEHKEVRTEHMAILFEWSRRRKMRITFSEQQVLQRRAMGIKSIGIVIGEW